MILNLLFGVVLSLLALDMLLVFKLTLCFSFKFLADVPPDLSSVEVYVDGRKAQGNISKVTVWNKLTKVQLRLDITGCPSNAD